MILILINIGGNDVYYVPSLWDKVKQHLDYAEYYKKFSNDYGVDDFLRDYEPLVQNSFKNSGQKMEQKNEVKSDS